MLVNIRISNRHVHLCKKDFDFLFGNSDFYSVKDLNQGGEFSSNLFVDIKTKKNSINHVRVVGPLREKTQVEISKTDSYFLGINPPIRMSGDLRNSENVTIVNDNKELLSFSSCILAKRHIHVNTKDVEKLNIHDKDIVKVRIPGEKGGVLDNVEVKVANNYYFELHVDTDDANAMGVEDNQEVEII